MTKDIYDMLCILLQSDEPICVRYKRAYLQFAEVLNEEKGQSDILFSGYFAQLDYLCKRLKYDNRQYTRINGFRVRGRNADNYSEEELLAWYLYDIKSFAEFVADLHGESVPKEIMDLLPTDYKRSDAKLPICEYLRVVVDSWDNEYIYARVDCADSDLVKVSYTENSYGDWTYLKELLEEHCQLNLIHPKQEGNIYQPDLIIYEPDYLVNITSITACFAIYGTSELNHLIGKLKSIPNTRHILLGNFAGQMLDEEVNDLQFLSYEERVRTFFRNNGLNIVTADIDRNFHSDAKNQLSNIKTILKKGEIDVKNALIEPTFFSEMLGIQGRMDLLQSNYKVLFEQKSGKKDEWRNSYRVEHYVQLLLYQALLHYGFHCSNSDIAAYLLYSKYSDGLLRGGAAPRLLFEAFEIRNRLVRLNERLAKDTCFVQQILDELEPELLKGDEVGERLWNDYSLPELKEILDPIHRSSELARAYFFRMLSFVERELWLAKVGNAQKECSGFASMWQSTVEEKKAVGNLLDGLSVVRLSEAEWGGIEQVVLQVPLAENEELPNFRVGDIAILYTYKRGKEPDARASMVIRGMIKSIMTEEITLKFRNVQRNKQIFSPEEGYMWAIEHDFMESSFASLYRGVFSLLTANEDRRSLLLMQRSPKIDESLVLNGDYGTFNRLVLRAKQAKDYFLVIGPPGTGKTSMGLINILKESLSEAGSTALLLAYTNRAVDEICSKLKKHAIDFCRIGTTISCEEDCGESMLQDKLQSCGNVSEIKEMVRGLRVVVGTTSALLNSINLFKLKRFDIAIIDEASQLLEPQIMGLLTAKNGGKNSISKFVLIGDHKQLPAVVMQSNEDSTVKEESLRAIGLKDCRSSLFERLLRGNKGNEGVVYQLDRQGRMHHVVSEFSNVAFYHGILKDIPVAHQREEHFFKEYGKAEVREKLLAEHRFLFLASDWNEQSRQNVNLHEAQMVAATVKSLSELYSKNGLPFTNRSVGVIVPYRSQISLIRNELIKEKIDPDVIAIDTVERFQGSERDCIIYSFTVERNHQLKFLSANVLEDDGVLIDRKLNVALTRARELMVLIGNSAVLSADRLFRALINFTKKRGGYYEIPCEEYCRGVNE